ncbi:MAG: hypothetical protein MJZ10_07575 [Fibrobacter sp.]|nr:hypothetical protein [Fibrobacter sp.]
MAKNVKMMKRTGTHGAASAIHCSAVAISIISKTVDFISAGLVSSAFLLSSPRVILIGSHRVILSGAKDPAFIS